MKIAALALATGLMAASAVPALAGPVDNRLAKQASRISHGVSTGMLTYREAATLRAQQWRIRYMVRQARKSRGMQPWERRKIMASLDYASKRIYQLKHNGARRFVGKKHFGKGHGHRHGRPGGWGGWGFSFYF